MSDRKKKGTGSKIKLSEVGTHGTKFGVERLPIAEQGDRLNFYQQHRNEPVPPDPAITSAVKFTKAVPPFRGTIFPVSIDAGKPSTKCRSSTFTNLSKRTVTSIPNLPFAPVFSGSEETLKDVEKAKITEVKGGDTSEKSIAKVSKVATAKQSADSIPSTSSKVQVKEGVEKQEKFRSEKAHAQCVASKTPITKINAGVSKVANVVQSQNSAKATCSEFPVMEGFGNQGKLKSYEASHEEVLTHMKTFVEVSKVATGKLSQDSTTSTCKEVRVEEGLGNQGKLKSNNTSYMDYLSGRSRYVESIKVATAGQSQDAAKATCWEVPVMEGLGYQGKLKKDKAPHVDVLTHTKTFVEVSKVAVGEPSQDSTALTCSDLGVGEGLGNQGKLKSNKTSCMNFLSEESRYAESFKVGTAGQSQDAAKASCWEVPVMEGLGNQGKLKSDKAQNVDVPARIEMSKVPILPIVQELSESAETWKDEEKPMRTDVKGRDTSEKSATKVSKVTTAEKNPESFPSSYLDIRVVEGFEKQEKVKSSSAQGRGRGHRNRGSFPRRNVSDARNDLEKRSASVDGDGDNMELIHLAKEVVITAQDPTITKFRTAVVEEENILPFKSSPTLFVDSTKPLMDVHIIDVMSLNEVVIRCVEPKLYDELEDLELKMYDDWTNHKGQLQSEGSCQLQVHNYYSLIIPASASANDVSKCVRVQVLHLFKNMESKSNKAFVFFIDYGMTEMVMQSDIFFMKSEWKRLPQLSCHARIQGSIGCPVNGTWNKPLEIGEEYLSKTVCVEPQEEFVMDKTYEETQLPYKVRAVHLRIFDEEAAIRSLGLDW